MRFNDSKFEPYVSVSAAPAPVRYGTVNPTRKKPVVENVQSLGIWAASVKTMAKIDGGRRTKLETLAMLVKANYGGTGDFWQDIPGGWQDGVGTIMTFVDMDAIIDQRCAELGISRSKAEVWLTESHGIDGSRAFYDLPFEQRMQRFRTGGSL